MKYIATLSLLVVSGSIFYYLVIFLPQQNIKNQEDINAIRKVVAPTPEQQKVQKQNSQKSAQDANKKMDEYFACENDMAKKRDAYLKRACPNSDNEPLYILRGSECIDKAMNTPEYKAFTCEYPIVY